MELNFIREDYAVPIIENPNQPRARQLKYSKFSDYFKFLSRKIEDSNSVPIGSAIGNPVSISNIKYGGISPVILCKGIITGDAYFEFYVIVDDTNINANWSYVDIIFTKNTTSNPAVYANVSDGELFIRFNSINNANLKLIKLETHVISGSNAWVDATEVTVGNLSGSGTRIPTRTLNGLIQSNMLAFGSVKRDNLNYTQASNGTQFYLARSSSGASFSAVSWKNMVGLMNTTAHVTKQVGTTTLINDSSLTLDNDTITVPEWYGDITIYFVNANDSFTFDLDNLTSDHVGAKFTIVNKSGNQCYIRRDNSAVFTLDANKACEFRIAYSSGIVFIRTTTLISYYVD